MKMYSVAFCPEQVVVTFVFRLRKGLKNIIGPFDRENTEAHATINVFPPMLSVLNAWERHLCERLRFAEPFEICFDSIGHFQNTKLNTYTLCLFPDEESKRKMQLLMKSVNSKSPKAFEKITNPHITVAYGLSKEQLNKAIDYLADRTFDVRFICNNLAIRKREDGLYEHYKVYKRFEFGKPVDSLLF